MSTFMILAWDGPSWGVLPYSRSIAARGGTQRRAGGSEGAASIRPTTGNSSRSVCAGGLSSSSSRRRFVRPPCWVLASTSGRPRPFERSRVLPQSQQLAFPSLCEGGWLKAMRLAGYAPGNPCRPEELQQALFAYHEAWGWLLGLPIPPTSALRRSRTYAAREKYATWQMFRP